MADELLPWLEKSRRLQSIFDAIPSAFATGSTDSAYAETDLANVTGMSCFGTSSLVLFVYMVHLLRGSRCHHSTKTALFLMVLFEERRSRSRWRFSGIVQCFSTSTHKPPTSGKYLPHEEGLGAYFKPVVESYPKGYARLAALLDIDAQWAQLLRRGEATPCPHPHGARRRGPSRVWSRVDFRIGKWCRRTWCSSKMCYSDSIMYKLGPCC
jgi:hypothetical protein